MLEDTAVHRMFQLTRFVRDNGRLPSWHPTVGDAAQRTFEKSMYTWLRKVKDWASVGGGATEAQSWYRGSINWYRKSAKLRSAYDEFAALQQSRDRPLTAAENSKFVVLRDKVKPWVTRERRMPRHWGAEKDEAAVYLVLNGLQSKKMIAQGRRDYLGIVRPEERCEQIASELEAILQAARGGASEASSSSSSSLLP